MLSQCRFAGFKIYKQACSVQKSLGIGVLTLNSGKMLTITVGVNRTLTRMEAAVGYDGVEIWVSVLAFMKVRAAYFFAETLVLDLGFPASGKKQYENERSRHHRQSQKSLQWVHVFHFSISTE